MIAILPNIMDNIKEREIIRKIEVRNECMWFAQAMLEDTHLVSVSLGTTSVLTIFYDKKVEEIVNEVLKRIIDFF